MLLVSTLCIERKASEGEGGREGQRKREGGVRERGGRREGDKERGREGGSLHHVFVHNIKLSFVLGRD